MRLPPIRRVPLVFALLVALGCGGEEAPRPAAPGDTADPAVDPTAGAGPDGAVDPATAAGPDACAIVTAADVTEVIGRAPAAAGHGPTGRPNICDYDLGEGSSVSVVVYPELGRETLEAGGPGTPIEGVGDEAKWLESGRLLGALQGDQAITIGMLVFDGTDDATLQRQAAELARRGLDRL